MDNKIIEKLKREQRQTRIIGIVLLCVGIVFYPIFALSPLMLIPAILSIVGLVMTVRSFVHCKFAVIKQKNTAYSAQTGNCSGKISESPMDDKTSNSPMNNKISESPMDLLMTSQFVALSLYAPSDNESAGYHEQYIERLNRIGIDRPEAEKFFAFESDIIKKYNKQYLTDPNFTKNWFFGLQKKFFQSYPQEKEDILKERFLTMSELCKIIDEAEWHVWNSHENSLPEGVWEEIWQWRLKGAGGDFAVKYFDMIVETAGVSEKSVGSLGGEQGRHLSKYKWR